MFAEQRYKRRLDRLIRAWVEHRNLMTTRHGLGAVSPEEENRFLALKGRIAEDLSVVAHHGGGGVQMRLLGRDRGVQPRCAITEIGAEGQQACGHGSGAQKTTTERVSLIPSSFAPPAESLPG